MRKIFFNGRAFLVSASTIATGLLVSGVAHAEGEVAAMVTAMPAIDMSILTSSGTKVFACVAVVVAIGLGIKMFRKA